MFKWASINPPIGWRSWGKLSAGVQIFSPPRLLIEEPRGQERQGLVVMPGDPGPHLIVPQSGLPLGPLEALLDAMFRLGNPCQFLKRDTRVAVRQIVIMFKIMIGLTLPRDEE